MAFSTPPEPELILVPEIITQNTVPGSLGIIDNHLPLADHPGCYL